MVTSALVEKFVRVSGATPRRSGHRVWELLLLYNCSLTTITHQYPTWLIALACVNIQVRKLSFVRDSLPESR